MDMSIHLVSSIHMNYLVNTYYCKNIRDILDKEFIEKKIPLLIRRYLPNNSYEDWKLSELTYSSEF